MHYTEFLTRTAFSKEEILAHAKGLLVEDPPKDGVGRLPSPPFLMFDRVVELERNKSSGHIVAEYDVKPDAWYFQCHFVQDPVQPGCLGVDAVWQLIGFYCLASGATGAGRALGCREVNFFGQIRPYDQLVRYEIDIRRFTTLRKTGFSIAIGDGRILVDGVEIYSVLGGKVGVFRDIAYTDYPISTSRFARGGLIERDDKLNISGRRNVQDVQNKGAHDEGANL